MPADDGCSFPACDRPFNAKGLCKVHYERQRTGRPLEGPIRIDYRGMPIVERLARQSEMTPSGCVEWRGVVNINGYGQVNFNGQHMGAYRASYLVAVGPIPDGFEIDHLCRNRLCINPEHLEAVTRHENWRRSENPMAINARKTHCKRGHEFTDVNTLRHTDGRRECRACIALRRSSERAA